MRCVVPSTHLFLAFNLDRPSLAKILVGCMQTDRHAPWLPSSKGDQQNAELAAVLRRVCSHDITKLSSMFLLVMSVLARDLAAFLKIHYFPSHMLALPTLLHDILHGPCRVHSSIAGTL